MGRFEIALAGRWRNALTQAPPSTPQAGGPPPDCLCDHIELRLGERSLTAHLGDDAVLPFLTALAEQLAEPLPAAGVHIPLYPSGHALRLTTEGGHLLLSFLTETGRHVVHDVPSEPGELAGSVVEAGRRFLAELVAMRPSWGRHPTIRRLRAALRRLPAPGEGAGGEAPRLPTNAGRSKRLRERPRGGLPLSLSGGVLRLGAVPASPDPRTGRPGPVSRLFDAVEALARAPARRVSLGWSSPPRTALHLERQADGTVTWTLADAAAPWMSGVATMGQLVRALVAVAAAGPTEEREARRLALVRIRAWLRAAQMPPLLGAPVLLAPPRVAAAREADPLVARRLFHVAFRQQWRRALRRFHLPPQELDGEVVVLHTAEGTLGLTRSSGREAWRLPGAHPLLPSGPAWLLVAPDARLMRIDPTAGTVVWRQGSPWRRPPIVALAHDAHGFVLATESGEIIGFSSSGARQFRSRTVAGGVLGLSLGPALVWLTCEDRCVYAFRRADGALHFRVPVEGLPAGAPIWTRQGLLVGSERGARTHLATLDPGTGSRTAELELPGLLQSLQPVGNGVALQLQAEETTTTAVIDPAAGRVRFTLPNGPWRSTLTTYRGALYIGGHGGRVTAHDAQDGHPIWELAGDDVSEDHAHHVRPLGVRGLLYVLGGSLRVLEPETGRVVSRHALDGVEVGTWLVSPGGDVLLADPERALLYLTLSGHLSHVD